MSHKAMIKKSILRGMSFSQEMREIIRPLESIDITHFSYQIKQNGYRKATISDCQSYLEEYFQRIDAYPDNAFFDKNDYAPESSVVTSKLYDSVKNPITRTMEKHGVRQWVLLKNNDILNQKQEFFWFMSSVQDNNLVEKLTNNLGSLYHFSVYLKDRGKKMISEATLAEEDLPKPMVCQKIITPRTPALHFDIKNYHLGYPFKKSLSSQEFSCLKLFYVGFSAKEIGKKLIISPRTVEKYLESVRTKIELPTGKTIRQALLSCQIFMQLMHSHGEYLVKD